MRLKHFLIFLFLPVFTFSQTGNQGQSIELPDFVITGVQQILIPTAVKPKPQLISTLSKEFITPSFSPESFALSGVSVPPPPSLDLSESRNNINGEVKVGAGLYTLPVGELNLSKAFSNALLFAGIWGLNEREFVDNAGYNVTGGLMKVNFFLSNNSKFLPGLTISVNGNYFQDVYKFYGSSTPGEERKTKNLLVSFNTTNSQNKNFIYDFNLSAKNLAANEQDFNERILKAKAMLQFDISGYGIVSNTYFINQGLANNFSAESGGNFFSTDNRLLIKPSENILIKAGLLFAAKGSISNLFPVGSISLKLSERFSFFGEYSPFVEFQTVRDFLDINRFYTFSAIENNSQKYKHKFKGAIKYSYFHFVELSLGASFESIDNFLYFQDTTAANKFYAFTEDDIKRYSIFAGAMFHLGPFGYLYGDIAYISTKNDDKKIMPYNPEFILKFVYGYDFQSGIGVKTTLEIASLSYTDLSNTSVIPSSINISAAADYSLAENLKAFVELSNLLNRKNYLKQNYRQKPFDILLGVNYRW